ncbi:hypothetical protein Taro_013064, partial [Colocasia esculenta]|nr:hypothetical protein [Colocasia esculenta]
MLRRGPSDHCLLALSYVDSVSGSSHFVFQEMWTSHDTFMGVVSEVWNANSDSIINPLLRLSVKLKEVKKALKLWNKEVWKFRCTARMEGITISLDTIKNKILLNGRKVLDCLKFNRPISFSQALILKDFNVKAEIRARAPIIVRWNPPVNNYSLNADGACKGNPGICGGGGCFRDHNGDFVCDFAFFLWHWKQSYGRD